MPEKKLEEGSEQKRRWAAFWTRGRPLDEIYDNDDRIVEETLRTTPVEGWLILEVGAATARDSVSLSSHGATAVALDYVPEALALARQAATSAGSPLLLVCGDAESLPFADGVFDMVFHQGVLEHFRDPGRLVSENARVLRDDGVLLVDVPQTFHVYTLLKKPLIALGRWFAGWETQFTRGGLERLLSDSGLMPFRAYGRFFSPSLAYRVLREALMRLGVRLPLRPVILPPLHRLRRSLRTGVERRLGPRLGYVLGVFARKQHGTGGT
ncbi:methyltransferase domain-containing protein [Candidatus Fermentibacterales bacterium]|nr:methyltransferase domain-containing protein [Candidatus Fermentibacterales bacterium]